MGAFKHFYLVSQWQVDVPRSGTRGRCQLGAVWAMSTMDRARYCRVRRDQSQVLSCDCYILPCPPDCWHRRGTLVARKLPGLPVPINLKRSDSRCHKNLETANLCEYNNMELRVCSLQNQLVHVLVSLLVIIVIVIGLALGN